MTCPDFSFASLFYPHPHLNFVQIYGLPLQQDSSNATLSCPTSSNLETLDLHYNGLTSTPFSSCPAYFSNLQYAMIENQKLKLDDTPLFTSENHLIYLSLRHCSLQNIPRSTFVGLFHLKMLNFSHNNISLFEKETFHDLTNLTVLRIDNNALTALDMSVFHQLKSLQYLYLSGNHLSSLDGGVAILSSLRFIDLSFNNLTVVRTELFRNSPLLTYIELKYNSISNIEFGAFANMTSFVALGAATNELIHVNPCNWFDGVAKIMTLALANNNISSVEGLECVPYLQVFNLFDNELSIMPLLRNHVYLGILDLGLNAIHIVSGNEITSVTSLKYLFLDGNEMLRLGVLNNSSSIEVVNLEFNNLTYIPAYCFNGLQSLTTLNASYNYIKHIGAFAFPKNLQILSLNDNQLSDLDSINKHLPQLNTLEISHNNLTKFNISLSCVIYFDISDNPLQNLAKSLQLCTKMPKLQNIFLENLGIGHDEKINADLFGKSGMGSTQWRRVSLARNRISKIDKYSMLYRVNEVIDYSHNPLRYIPKYPDFGFNQKYLYFNNCSIEGIAPLAFQYVIYVDFKGNYIQYFPHMSPADIEYDLRNNPIVCSCHLRWLHVHPTRRKYLFTNCMDLVTESLEVFDLMPRDRLVCQHEVNCAQGCVCFGMDTYAVSIIKCSFRSLTAIPHKLSPEADVIYLDHNQLRKPHFCKWFGQNGCKSIVPPKFENSFFGTGCIFSISFAADNRLILQWVGHVEHGRVSKAEWSQKALSPQKLYPPLTLWSCRIWSSWFTEDHATQVRAGCCSRNHRQFNGQYFLHQPHFSWEPLEVCCLYWSHPQKMAGSTCGHCLGCCRYPLQQVTAPNLRHKHRHSGVCTMCECYSQSNKYPLGHYSRPDSLHGVNSHFASSHILLQASHTGALVQQFWFPEKKAAGVGCPIWRTCYLWRKWWTHSTVDCGWTASSTGGRVGSWRLSGWERYVSWVNHAEEIAQSIHQSRRTLIVVSQNFVENEWAQFAYQAAFQFQIENNLHRVLVVAWEPVETDTMEYNIKVYFDTKQVMCRASRRFWPVLRSKLHSWQKRLLHPGMMCLFCDYFYFISPRGLRTGCLV